MRYDRKLLENWATMPDWGDYIIANGGLNNASQEGFNFLTKEYYTEIKRRISCCKEILKEHKDALICYTLAELYDRCNEDESPAYAYKWLVRYYAICALEIDPSFESAKLLLERVKDWLSFLSEEKGIE